MLDELWLCELVELRELAVSVIVSVLVELLDVLDCDDTLVCVVLLSDRLEVLTDDCELDVLEELPLDECEDELVLWLEGVRELDELSVLELELSLMSSQPATNISPLWNSASSLVEKRMTVGFPSTPPRRSVSTAWNSRLSRSVTS